jgi:hypothetical protein
MGFFRRRPEETLNEQELREAGLASTGDTPPTEERQDFDTASSNEPPADESWWDALNRAMARPAVWDLVTTAHVTGIDGDRVEFATLPSGELIVDAETGDGDLSPLADVVEKELAPPYRVLARREEGQDDLWGVAARTIDVVELHFEGGDEIELVENDGSTELRVGGELRNEPIPELEHAGETLGSDFVVQADRLDGDLWEIRVSAL